MGLHTQHGAQPNPTQPNRSVLHHTAVAGQLLSFFFFPSLGRRLCWFTQHLKRRQKAVQKDETQDEQRSSLTQTICSLPEIDPG